jgi:hypothetical protein
MGTKPTTNPDDIPPEARVAHGIARVLTFVRLGTLEPGTRFMFYADDLPNRGPCTLVEKSSGSATIEYAPHEEVKTIKFRDKDGQIKIREIRQTLSGRSYCSLGAQVVPL